MKKIILTLISMVVFSASVNAQYKLGQIIELDGVKGVVFKLDAEPEKNRGIHKGSEPAMGRFPLLQMVQGFGSWLVSACKG